MLVNCNSIFEEVLNRAKDHQDISFPYKGIEGACSQIEGFSFSKMAYSVVRRDFKALCNGESLKRKCGLTSSTSFKSPQSGNSGTAFSYETPDASSGETKQPDGEDDLEEASCTHDES
ncbi:hypothetical protein EMCRGX_G009829 [Ephydatia muelleri]